jgi:hypothetical protein
MRAFWRALGRILFWSYERMTWQYDVMVALIVVFVLLTPRYWFHDQPRPVVSVQLVSQDAGNRMSTYRLNAKAFETDGRPAQAPPGLREGAAVDMTPEFLHHAKSILSSSVSDLKSSSFQIVSVRLGLASDGTVAYYDVTVQR